MEQMNCQSTFNKGIVNGNINSASSQLNKRYGQKVKKTRTDISCSLAFNPNGYQQRAIITNWTVSLDTYRAYRLKWTTKSTKSIEGLLRSSVQRLRTTVDQHEQSNNYHRAQLKRGEYKPIDSLFFLIYPT